MSKKTPLVLLVGTDLMSLSHLRERLQYWDCEFHFAATDVEAHELLNRNQFDLVLSETGLPDGWAARLIPWLLGSPTTLFLAFPVDGIRWWFLAVAHGQPCRIFHALRSNEFASALDKILYELVSGEDREPHSEAQSLLPVLAASTSDLAEPLLRAAAAVPES